MNTTSKKKVLGKGLRALLESPETDITSQDISGNFVAGAIANIPIQSIESNPFQPRTNFEIESLNELAESIKEHGIIQPISVRKLGYDKYQLISGERRYKAAIIAELDEIPAYIRIANDQQMLEMSLIENIQRRDLNPIEISISFNRLIEECDLTQEELSKNIGKDRSTVSNYLRLLKLPMQIQVGLRDNRITMGHARAIINIDDPHMQLDIYNKIISQNLSVREVEEMVRQINKPLSKSQSKNVQIPEPFKKTFEKLQVIYGKKTNIKINNKGKGSIVLPFNSEKEFDNLTHILLK